MSFEERIEALRRGEKVYVRYEGEYLRMYEFKEEGGETKVTAKDVDGRKRYPDYERSNETKDALYVGDTISAEDFKNNIW